ncbi:MAG: OmpA family protein [Blastocatellia bacterium]|nr:OmpA family protein [Blastocatellia bacterium]
MNIERSKTSRLKLNWIVVISMAIGCFWVSAVAQQTQTKTIPAGEKTKINGRITQRDAETFTVNSPAGQETVVLLTDTTSVRSKKKGLGIFRRGEEYAVTSLLRGLVVDVEGVGNDKGELVAEKVRFNEADLKTTNTVNSRVAPVEEATKKLSGQVDEAGSVAQEAKGEAARARGEAARAQGEATRAQGEAARANEGVMAANRRISGLDNFDEKRLATVYFTVNSYVVSPEAKHDLDALAQEALVSKAYLIEVAGFADPTGNAEKNLVLSQRRADAVVKYLAISGKIPMRRIVTPMGYGSTRSAAENNTPEGRKQERKVEIRLLINHGQNQQ